MLIPLYKMYWQLYFSNSFYAISVPHTNISICLFKENFMISSLAKEWRWVQIRKVGYFPEMIDLVGNQAIHLSPGVNPKESTKNVWWGDLLNLIAWISTSTEIKSYGMPTVAHTAGLPSSRHQYSPRKGINVASKIARVRLSTMSKYHRDYESRFIATPQRKLRRKNARNQF